MFTFENYFVSKGCLCKRENGKREEEVSCDWEVGGRRKGFSFFLTTSFNPWSRFGSLFKWNFRSTNLFTIINQSIVWISSQVFQFQAKAKIKRYWIWNSFNFMKDSFFIYLINEKTNRIDFCLYWLPWVFETVLFSSLIAWIAIAFAVVNISLVDFICLTWFSFAWSG